MSRVKASKSPPSSGVRSSTTFAIPPPPPPISTSAPLILANNVFDAVLSQISPLTCVVGFPAIPPTFNPAVPASNPKKSCLTPAL